MATRCGSAAGRSEACLVCRSNGTKCCPLPNAPQPNTDHENAHAPVEDLAPSRETLLPRLSLAPKAPCRKSRALAHGFELLPGRPLGPIKRYSCLRRGFAASILPGQFRGPELKRSVVASS